MALEAAAGSNSTERLLGWIRKRREGDEGETNYHGEGESRREPLHRNPAPPENMSEIEAVVQNRKDSSHEDLPNNHSIAAEKTNGDRAADKNCKILSHGDAPVNHSTLGENNDGRETGGCDGEGESRWKIVTLRWILTECK